MCPRLQALSRCIAQRYDGRPGHLLPRHTVPTRRHVRHGNYSYAPPRSAGPIMRRHSIGRIVRSRSAVTGGYAFPVQLAHAYARPPEWDDGDPDVRSAARLTWLAGELRQAQRPAHPRGAASPATGGTGSPSDALEAMHPSCLRMVGPAPDECVRLLQHGFPQPWYQQALSSPDSAVSALQFARKPGGWKTAGWDAVSQALQAAGARVWGMWATLRGPRCRLSAAEDRLSRWLSSGRLRPPAAAVAAALRDTEERPDDAP